MPNWGLTDIGALVALAVGLFTLWSLIKNAFRGIKQPIEDIKKQVQEIIEGNKQRDAALCAILSTEISRIHREFMVMGKIDRLARKLVINLYEQYKALGGDGYVDAEMEDLKKLTVMMPTKDAEQCD